MLALQFLQFVLVLLVPGLLGALVYSLVSAMTAEMPLRVALILDLLTFTIMITGLYFFKEVVSVTELLTEFSCLNFTRNYILLSTLINIVLGAIGGLLRRLFQSISSRRQVSNTPTTQVNE